jgi:ketopantoate reductase
MVGAKAQDVPALLAAYTGRAGAAFSVQNGARQAEPVVARFGAAAVGCVSMVGGTLDGPGVVSHTFEGVTYLGDLASSAPGTAAAIAAAFPPGTPLDVRPDIVGVLWAKAVLATAVMGTTALTRLAYHHMFVQPGAREVFLDIVTEAASIAAAEGVELIDLPGPMQAGALIRLPRAEALARLAAIGEHMVATGQTNVRVSMLQSIESGRPLEVGAVFRDLVEVADRHSVHVPLLLATTRLLETIDAVNRSGPDGGGR